MCEHCGCRGVQPIAELMDEHYVLLDLAGEVRRAQVVGDTAAAQARLGRLAQLLTRHVEREDRGVLAALKQQGDYASAAEDLEREHVVMHGELERLDAGDPEFGLRVLMILDDLTEHIAKENLGVFPVAVVTLGADGWETVSRAHKQPSFLAERA